MPLPHFLALILAVIAAAAATIALVHGAGLPMAAVAILALLAAGAIRLFA